MPVWPQFRNHLRSLLWKVSVTEEVDSELDFHLEMRTRELMAQGMDRDRAHQAALARFGSMSRLKRECRRIARSRDRRYGLAEWWLEVVQDLAFALRQFGRAPSWTLLVVLTFAFSIAANTVVFSVVEAVVLRPLPWPQPDRLFRVRQLTPQGGGFSVSDPNFLDFQERNRSLSALAAIAFPPPQFALTGNGEPLDVSALSCTSRFFDVLGIRPALGRTFVPEEGSRGSKARVAVLSHGLWLDRFGADPSVVGRGINLNGETWTVIGVLPRQWRFPIAAEIWIPYAPDPASNRDDHRLEGFGRLRPGVGAEQARQDLEAIALRLAAEYPDANKGWGVRLESFSEWLIGPWVRTVALVLGGTVILMLLLASANVSGLLLARATARVREMEIRAALGASRWRIVRQLVTESMLLSLLGGAAGLALTAWALPVLVALNPDALPRLDEVSVNGKVLLCALLVSSAAGLLAGLAPAIHVSRGGRFSSLRQSHGSAPAIRRHRDALVVGELTLAMTLLIGAGLLLTSLIRLQNTNPGFEPSQELLASVELPANRYPEMSPATAAFYRDALDRVRGVSSVLAAGASMVNPFRGFNPSNQAGAEQARDLSQFVRLQWRAVTPGYFRAVGATLLKGRVFDDSDRPGAGEPPVIVSQELARLLWPAEDRIGKRLQWNKPGGAKLLVVGLVAGIRDVSLQSAPEPMAFLPHSFVPWPNMTLFIKTGSSPESVASGVRSAIWDVDPNIPVPELTPLSSRLASATAGPRLNARLLSLFAGIALLMAVMGIYGVVSYEVTSRTREIGVRTALGASTGAVLRLVVSRGLRLIAAGLVLGLLGAFLLSRFLGSLLYEISPTNWPTYAAVAFLFAGVGILAAWFPALRAARVNPVVALREE